MFCQAFLRRYFGKLRVPIATILWDIKNAFPSPTHDVLTQMAEEVGLGGIAKRMVMQRFTTSCVLLETPQNGTENALLHARCGNQQGDTVAPDQFLSVFFPHVFDWLSLVEE